MLSSLHPTIILYIFVPWKQANFDRVCYSFPIKIQENFKVKIHNQNKWTETGIINIPSLEEQLREIKPKSAAHLGAMVSACIVICRWRKEGWMYCLKNLTLVILKCFSFYTCPCEWVTKRNDFVLVSNKTRDKQVTKSHACLTFTNKNKINLNWIYIFLVKLILVDHIFSK